MRKFEEIYSEYFGEVYKFVLALCQDQTVAEEVTQEAFFKALKNIDNFKGESSLSTWLCQIAKNTFYTYCKKQNRQADKLEEAIESNKSIEEQFLDKETALRIHNALHKLDQPYKEVFWLRTFGELSFAQIGAIFNKTENWATVTYHRARMKIKEEIK